VFKILYTLAGGPLHSEWTIKNGKPRDTSNIGNTRLRQKTRTNKTKQKHNTENDEQHGHYKKQMNNKQRTATTLDQLLLIKSVCKLYFT
jgi:hypothetical protein